MKERKKKEEEEGAGHGCFLRTYTQNEALFELYASTSSIIHPAIQANTFEIKPGTIQMVQNSVSFGGASTEDPNMHIRNFVEICSTFKYNGITDEAIKLRLFPFSLRDKAKDWLHSLPAGSITTWEDLAQKFLVKFYPMTKTAAMRSALT
ncbi:hypothetical protein AgCh_017503 [Apium graveolens]